MNINKFTIKTQEALQGAVALARRSGHQAIEPVHLLSSLMTLEGSPLPFLLGKLGIVPKRLEEQLTILMAQLPKVSGGEPYLSNTSNAVLLKAEDIATEMRDDYVALEHLLLAILSVESPTSKLLKADLGAKEGELRAAITELRGGSRITSQSAEEQYQAL